MADITPTPTFKPGDLVTVTRPTTLFSRHAGMPGCEYFGPIAMLHCYDMALVLQAKPDLIVLCKGHVGWVSRYHVKKS
jgi:hypothetical protein